MQKRRKYEEKFKQSGERSFSGSGQVKPSNEEVYRLKKQLGEVTIEREIKKAAAIFLKPKG